MVIKSVMNLFMMLDTDRQEIAHAQPEFRVFLNRLYMVDNIGFYIPAVCLAHLAQRID